MVLSLMLRVFGLINRVVIDFENNNSIILKIILFKIKYKGVCFEN